MERCRHCGRELSFKLGKEYIYEESSRFRCDGRRIEDPGDSTFGEPCTKADLVSQLIKELDGEIHNRG